MKRRERREGGIGRGREDERGRERVRENYRGDRLSEGG